MHITIDIPTSVEYVAQLDDPAAADAAGLVYAGKGKRGVALYAIERAKLVELVELVEEIARHGTDMSLSRRSGALRWAARIRREALTAQEG